MGTQLRTWDERPPPAPPTRTKSELRAFVEEVRVVFTDKEAQEFARIANDDWYVREYEIGYEEGRRLGLEEAIKAWLAQLSHVLKILALAVGTYERPGKPIPPELREELARTQAVLQALLPVMATFDKEGFFAAVDLLSAEVTKAMRAHGTAWLRQFFALNGQPRAQGHHVGKMIGSACGDVLIGAFGTVAAGGTGRVLAGTRAATRIYDISRRLVPDRPPPLDRSLNDVVRGALEAPHPPATAEALAKILDEPRRLAAKVRQRLGARLPREIADVLDNDDGSVLGRARALGRMDLDRATWILKGYIAERMYRNLPKFGALRGELAERVRKQLLGLDAEWDGKVHFKETVTGLAAERAAREIQLTDGMLVVFLKTNEGQRVVVLAIFESKSPTNIRDLILHRTKRGEPRSWGGQFHQDFERLSELPLVIDGARYEPGAVAVSRRGTQWVAVTSSGEDLGRQGLARLRDQGFHVDHWELPVTDAALNLAAKAVLEAVR